MKQFTTTLLAVLTAILLFAQAPQAFKYQAVARDNTGNILDSLDISFRISILEGSPSGITVYSETHDTITNSLGLVNLEIGNGTVVSGVFENIDWGNGPFYLQIEMDETGGDVYELLGVSQILSVPISLHSKTADISKGLVLRDQYGQEHTLSLDPEGNIVTDLIMECGDTIIDIRDGQQYTTVMIGSQCWLAENLNIGTRIDGIDDQMDNDTIEKYCYDNLESNCETYGALYQWDEAMQYETSPGIKGLCPSGWHIPTDHEWKVLEGTVDTHYGIGDPVWNISDIRGFDAGLNLKSTSGWASSGNGADLYDFKALPGGYGTLGVFYNITELAGFWTSNQTYPSSVWMRGLMNISNSIGRGEADINDALNIRCLKSYSNKHPIQPANPAPENGAIDVGIDTVLSWSCSDPDGDDLFYKIHFGTDPIPAYDTAGITDPIFDPGILDYNTTYYWKIVAFDSYGDSAVSNICSFTTETGTGFTCGDVFVDTRDGQSYSTVEIGTQCWLAENINIGTRIDGIVEQTQNSPTEIFEKYCYDDLETNCDTYGGMYQWDEAMQYISTPGVQGICPTGWHIPTDEEWKQLEGFADSNFGYPDPEWDKTGVRGYDAGYNLKSTNYWVHNGCDLYGFSYIPCGYRNSLVGSFHNLTTDGYSWSSSEGSSSNAWSRKMMSDWRIVTLLIGAMMLKDLDFLSAV